MATVTIFAQWPIWRRNGTGSKPLAESINRELWFSVEGMDRK